MIAQATVADENALVERDVADLLYGHARGGLFVTALASTAFVVILPLPNSQIELLTWLSIMLLTVAMRTANLLTSRIRRTRSDWDGRTEIRRFGSGVLVTAAVWAVFPLLFFHELSQLERTTVAMVVSAMAGGSATVLSASQRQAIVYCGALLLPMSLMFLLTADNDGVFLGSLGIVFFILMAFSSRVTHSATIASLRLNRTNEALLVNMAEERARTEEANAELTVAQSALHETLETLEERIEARTADLQYEIRERERYARELARLASTDSLTGFYNRATLTGRLGSERLRAEAANRSIAVLFLDLDRFKEVNDLKGHHWGDQVLHEVAKRLAAAVPPDAICARWGGDEFVFVLGDLIAADAAAYANAVASELRACVCAAMTLGSETVRIDATVGIALFPDHGGTADELIVAADMAMYAAKESSLSKVRTFDPVLADELRERHLLEDNLREALANDELQLVYQPIVDAVSGRCDAFEALARWHHPTHGTIGPTVFIPIAERSGEIVTIGRWVLVQACRAAASWPGTPPPAVSLNVSVTQIIAGTALDDVRAALADSGLPAQRLHVEVTESVFASDHRQIIPTLAALRAMGVRISLDDFGTGFSSLSYLRSLPIDTIKIDKSFVDDIHHESGPIIKAIRSLADAFGIDVIAEGVETADQAATLVETGVTLLQGYLFARPVPEAEVANWLQDAASVPAASDSIG